MAQTSSKATQTQVKTPVKEWVIPHEQLTTIDGQLEAAKFISKYTVNGKLDFAACARDFPYVYRFEADPLKQKEKALQLAIDYLRNRFGLRSNQQVLDRIEDLVEALGRAPEVLKDPELQSAVPYKKLLQQWEVEAARKGLAREQIRQKVDQKVSDWICRLRAKEGLRGKPVESWVEKVKAAAKEYVDLTSRAEQVRQAAVEKVSPVLKEAVRKSLPENIPPEVASKVISETNEAFESGVIDPNPERFVASATARIVNSLREQGAVVNPFEVQKTVAESTVADPALRKILSTAQRQTENIENIRNTVTVGGLPPTARVGAAVKQAIPVQKETAREVTLTVRKFQEKVRENLNELAEEYRKALERQLPETIEARNEVIRKAVEAIREGRVVVKGPEEFARSIGENLEVSGAVQLAVVQSSEDLFEKEKILMSQIRGEMGVSGSALGRTMTTPAQMMAESQEVSDGYGKALRDLEGIRERILSDFAQASKGLPPTLRQTVTRAIENQFRDGRIPPADSEEFVQRIVTLIRTVPPLSQEEKIILGTTLRGISPSEEAVKAIQASSQKAAGFLPVQRRVGFEPPEEIGAPAKLMVKLPPVVFSIVRKEAEISAVQEENWKSYLTYLSITPEGLSAQEVESYVREGATRYGLSPPDEEIKRIKTEFINPLKQFSSLKWEKFQVGTIPSQEAITPWQTELKRFSPQAWTLIGLEKIIPEDLAPSFRLMANGIFGKDLEKTLSFIKEQGAEKLNLSAENFEALVQNYQGLIEQMAGFANDNPQVAGILQGFFEKTRINFDKESWEAVAKKFNLQLLQKETILPKLGSFEVGVRNFFGGIGEKLGLEKLGFIKKVAFEGGKTYSWAIKDGLTRLLSFGKFQNFGALKEFAGGFAKGLWTKFAATGVGQALIGVVKPVLVAGAKAAVGLLAKLGIQISAAALVNVAPVVGQVLSIVMLVKAGLNVVKVFVEKIPVIGPLIAKAIGTIANFSLLKTAWKLLTFPFRMLKEGLSENDMGKLLLGVAPLAILMAGFGVPAGLILGGLGLLALAPAIIGGIGALLGGLGGLGAGILAGLAGLLATPLGPIAVISVVVIAIIVAVFLFIAFLIVMIAGGAFLITPYQLPSAPSQSRFLRMSKTASVESLTTEQLPAEVTYTIELNTLAGPLEILAREERIRTIPLKTPQPTLVLVEPLSWPQMQTIEGSLTLSFRATIGTELNDTNVLNNFTIRFRAPDGTDETQTVSHYLTVGNPPAADCPIPVGSYRDKCESYQSSNPCHGTNSYWSYVQGQSGQTCWFNIPLTNVYPDGGGPCLGPTSPTDPGGGTNVCYQMYSSSPGNLCSYYGLATDLKSLRDVNSTLVSLPSINGQCVIWRLVNSYAVSSTLDWGYGAVFGAVSLCDGTSLSSSSLGINSYEMNLMHLDQMPTSCAESNCRSGTIISGINRNSAHLHMEVRLNGDFVSPDNICP